MEGNFLRFYVDEHQTCQGVLLWEWLLETANRMGLRGGSAFRAIGGFGRHHAVHESRFFELAGTTAVEVEFIVSDEEMRRLLELVMQAKVRAFYALIPASFGVINPDVDDPALIEANC